MFSCSYHVLSSRPSRHMILGSQHVFAFFHVLCSSRDLRILMHFHFLIVFCVLVPFSVLNGFLYFSCILFFSRFHVLLVFLILLTIPGLDLALDAFSFFIAFWVLVAFLVLNVLLALWFFMFFSCCSPSTLSFIFLLDSPRRCSTMCIIVFRHT